jgi:hypothetical protein
MFIDVDDYAHTAGERSGTRIAVRTALATLICALIDWTEREDGGNHQLKPGDCGGCDRHPIAVSDTAFNHSWAVDVDINPNDNPFTMGTHHDLPTRVARVWNQYGFAWGDDYRGPKRDWMHFEFMGTPDDAVELSKLAMRDLVPGARR